MPGLVVTQHSGDGKASQYFLRGYNLDHGTDFASFVDNVPVNMPTNAHGQGDTHLNFLIPELVDHVDYRKGLYFAQGGDFASAGAAADGRPATRQDGVRRSRSEQPPDVCVVDLRDLPSASKLTRSRRVESWSGA